MPARRLKRDTDVTFVASRAGLVRHRVRDHQQCRYDSQRNGSSLQPVRRTGELATSARLPPWRPQAEPLAHERDRSRAPRTIRASRSARGASRSRLKQLAFRTRRHRWRLAGRERRDTPQVLLGQLCSVISNWRVEMVPAINGSAVTADLGRHQSRSPTCCPCSAASKQVPGLYLLHCPAMRATRSGPVCARLLADDTMLGHAARSIRSTTSHRMRFAAIALTFRAPCLRCHGNLRDHNRTFVRMAHEDADAISARL